MSDFTLDVVGRAIKLRIGGILHLTIKKCTLVAVQAWETGGMFYIEYSTTGGNILTEYNRIEKWKAVLQLLDENELFTV